MPTAPFIAPERDEAVAMGSPKQGSTTYYSVPGAAGLGVGTSSPGSGADAYSPMFVTSPIVVDQLACEVTTSAAGNIRMGIYRADKAWQPIGPPLTDSGDISTGTTGVKTFTPGTPLYLQRGRWLQVVNCSASPTLRILTGGFEGWIATTIGTNAGLGTFYATRAHAAFPTPGAAWTATDGVPTDGRWWFWLRVSGP